MNRRPFPLTLALVSYHKADVVGFALESAAKGSLPPDLLVLSDDGSSDGTPDAAEAAARKLGIPCRIVRHLRVGRYRLQAMRNTCVANALDGVVFLSDSDCIFGEHTLESHYEIHRRHPRAIGTGPRFEFLGGHSGPFTSTFTTLEFAHFPVGTHCVPVGANYSFKKRLWRCLSAFDRSYDGSYGLDEFDFSTAAVHAGAVCVSDPGAHVFHIPHESIFGNRIPQRNMAIFDRKWGKAHVQEERCYIERYVAPWYWSGRRKPPLLGERVVLDEWGAPAGFVPPLHLQLSRTLRPLLEAVEPAVATVAEAERSALRALVARIDTKVLAATSPALIYLQDLQWMLGNVGDASELERRLRYWLEGATAIERELSRGRAPRLSEVA